MAPQEPTVSNEAQLESQGTDTPARGRGQKRWFFAVLAYLFAALAVIGIFVPGLPTTPFVLLAAWAADRGSERMHAWLHNHPRLGPPLREWHEQRAVSTRAKALSVGLLTLSWISMLWLGVSRWALLFLGVLFLAVGGFVATRPTPRRRDLE